MSREKEKRRKGGITGRKKEERKGRRSVEEKERTQREVRGELCPFSPSLWFVGCYLGTWGFILKLWLPVSSVGDVVPMASSRRQTDCYMLELVVFYSVSVRPESFQ